MRKIEIKVRSASVFDTRVDKKNKKIDPKKFINTLGNKDEKVKSPNDMKNLVHFNHISNMLHVLLGVRPVSSRHNNFNFRTRSPYIDNIAKNSLFRFDNSVTYKTIDGTEELITTMIQGKNLYKDSNRRVSILASNGECSNSYLTWSYLWRKSIVSTQYKKALTVLNEFAQSINKSSKEFTVVDLLVKMRDYPKWIKRMNDISAISPITNFLSQNASNNHLTDIASSNYAGLANLIEPREIVRFDATILVFMKDVDAQSIINGKQIATFLDQGYASVIGTPHSIFDLDFIDGCDIQNYRLNCLENGFIDVGKLPFTQRNSLSII